MPESAVSPRVVIIASSMNEAQQVCKERGLEFDQVKWFVNPKYVGDADISGHDVFYSAAFTQRTDYGEAYSLMKQRTAKN